MLAVTHIATGSIREQLQDCFLVDDSLRLLIVADGHGPGGLTAAQKAIDIVVQRMREVAAITSPGENAMRLEEALNMALDSFNDSDSKANLAMVFINRGMVAAAASGQCVVLNWCIADLKPVIVKNRIATWPVQEKQNILLGSEGFVKILDHSEITDLLLAADEVNSDLIQSLADQADKLYDGDDRCIILLQTDKADLKAGEPRELELFEHYHREISMPLWAPLAVGAGLSTVAALLAKYLQRWWRHYR